MSSSSHLVLFPEGFGVKIFHLANLKNPRAPWFKQGFFFPVHVEKEQFSFSLCFIQLWNSPTVVTDLFLKGDSALTNAGKGSLPHQVGWGKKKQSFFQRIHFTGGCWKGQKVKRLFLEWSALSFDECHHGMCRFNFLSLNLGEFQSSLFQVSWKFEFLGAGTQDRNSQNSLLQSPCFSQSELRDNSGRCHLWSWAPLKILPWFWPLGALENLSKMWGL